MTKPIIESLLDIDFYKFTMGQLVFLKHPDVPVKFAFKNRTKKVKLAHVIDENELRVELDHAQTLRFNGSELDYLRSINVYKKKMFVEPYLEFLKNFQLPDYYLEYRNDDMRLEFIGPWSEVIYWETIALAIVNELYYRSLMRKLSRPKRETVYVRGRNRLMEKIKKFRGLRETKKHLPFLKKIIAEFGTRRRFSRDWQDEVVQTLAEEIPEMLAGTSNTLLAMKYGLMPIGTFAHELDMVYSGIYHDSDDEIRESHQRALEDWWELYEWGLSIALTDTYGTDFFFQSMTKKQAQNWKGLRQDSGDPFEFGKKAIKFYKSRGVNPKEKLVIFSDGLEVDTIVKLFLRFMNQFKISFGWGTNLTNDLGFKTLSLVIKTVEANGYGLVKLSDNLAKAIGKPEDVERFKRIFGHTVTTYKECKV